MTLEKLTSAIHNNVVSGLRGLDVNVSFSLEQIEDSIINERLQIIKEYGMKNMMPWKDLVYSIRCIKVDCESLDRCSCTEEDLMEDRVKHIELPQIVTDFGDNAIDFIGSSDGQIQYSIYTNNSYRSHRYKRRGATKPYVWIDTTPNKNNMLDAFIFNASPALSRLLVRVIPKDPRQLAAYECCADDGLDNITFIDAEIEKRVTEKYIRYYRQMAMAITPNDQIVKA